MEVLESASRQIPSTFHNPPLGAQLKARIATEFTPRWEQQWGGKFVLHGSTPKPEAVRLDGNDYLNLTGHPAIVQAQVDAMRKHTEFVVQSGVFHLDQHPAHQLEMNIANWIGKEDGCLSQSGYAANVGLLQIIADAHTPVYLDALAHVSLWEGVRAANAPAYLFRHNDAANLARLLASHGPGIVVVDSVYSTTGAVCRLAEIVDIVEQYNCMILVDESHSFHHSQLGQGVCSARRIFFHPGIITLLHALNEQIEYFQFFFIAA